MSSRAISLIPASLGPAPSVQFSRSVVSDSLWPHESQHARPPCPPPTPGVYSNSCPLSRWCHPTISSCVIPFSSCLQSFPASGSFQLSQLFASGGQSIGVSAFTYISWLWVRLNIFHNVIHFKFLLYEFPFHIQLLPVFLLGFESFSHLYESFPN